jgi:hypothetical protein
MNTNAIYEFVRAIKLGITSARVEVFCDDPDSFITRAVQVGANGSFDNTKNYVAP